MKKIIVSLSFIVLMLAVVLSISSKVQAQTTSTKFSLNSRVQTTVASVNVRATPATSGTLLNIQSDKVFGTVVGGPTYANRSWWWDIHFDNMTTGAHGWSTENNLIQAPVSATTYTPTLLHDFGGMYSKPTCITRGTCPIYPWSQFSNPVTNDSSCPSGYTPSLVWGSSSYANVYLCSRPHVVDRDPVYDFGGMYEPDGYSGQSNLGYANPITKSMSCPSSYTAYQIGGGYMHKNLYFCARRHIPAANDYYDLGYIGSGANTLSGYITAKTLGGSSVADAYSYAVSEGSLYYKYAGPFSYYPNASRTLATVTNIVASFLNTYDDHAGTWYRFTPGIGTNRMSADWNLSLNVTSPNTTASIASINIVMNDNAWTWSTSNAAAYPLVVFANGTQLNSAYGNTIPLNQGSGTFKLYGQIGAQNFTGGTITVTLTDGTQTSATLPSFSYVSASTPTSPVPTGTQVLPDISANSPQAVIPATVPPRVQLSPTSLPVTIQLNATLNSNGRTGLTTQWITTNNSPNVTFSSPNSLSTNATFTAAGTYYVRIWVKDSQGNYLRYSIIVVTINQPTATVGRIPGTALTSNAINAITNPSTTGNTIGLGKFHFTQFLSEGSSGNEVRELQKFLNGAGYDAGNVDGVFGAKVKEALIKFQTDNKLKSDGIMGYEVRGVLNSL